MHTSRDSTSFDDFDPLTGGGFGDFGGWSGDTQDEDDEFYMDSHSGANPNPNPNVDRTNV